MVSIIPPSILVLPGPVCVFIAVIIPLMSMVLASMLIWSEIIWINLSVTVNSDSLSPVTIKLILSAFWVIEEVFALIFSWASERSVCILLTVDVIPETFCLISEKSVRIDSWSLRYWVLLTLVSICPVRVSVTFLICFV